MIKKITKASVTELTVTELQIAGSADNEVIKNIVIEQTTVTAQPISASENVLKTRHQGSTE